MTPVYTHYDNLKVARNAPPEIIRAAYKTLTQKYHPDRNPGNADAARIMSIINTSYEVLSDPNKRLEHDQWVAQQEKNLRKQPIVITNPSRHQSQYGNQRPLEVLVSAALFPIFLETGGYTGSLD